MKLRFLGRTYPLAQQQMSTLPSSDIACFRGVRYHLRQPVRDFKPKISNLPMGATIQKYRGVIYIVEHHQLSSNLQRAKVCC